MPAVSSVESLLEETAFQQRIQLCVERFGSIYAFSRVCRSV